MFSHIQNQLPASSRCWPFFRPDLRNELLDIADDAVYFVCVGAPQQDCAQGTHVFG
ncbi:hypothetical protein O983_25330 [Mycobacterium avium 09-5983]|nr:hypothetical protein O984_00190 [Mycobacterium avium 05-4293]ETB18085.1 hypothetical protein O983_25330 [Mycobacterium avium 09-5983]ETB36704.1 hypothetical protein N602_23440 [Mycobacterium avium subsp. hominissuis 10-5606]